MTKIIHDPNLRKNKEGHWTIGKVYLTECGRKRLEEMSKKKKSDSKKTQKAS